MMESNHLALFESLKGLIVATSTATEQAFDHMMATAHGDIAQGNAGIVFHIAYGQRRP